MSPALSSLWMVSCRGGRARPDCTPNHACARKRSRSRCAAEGGLWATRGCDMRAQARGVGWVGRAARWSEPRLMSMELACGSRAAAAQKGLSIAFGLGNTRIGATGWLRYKGPSTGHGMFTGKLPRGRCRPVQGKALGCMEGSWPGLQLKQSHPGKIWISPSPNTMKATLGSRKTELSVTAMPQLVYARLTRRERLVFS